jgi:hypothetical protein
MKFLATLAFAFALTTLAGCAASVTPDQLNATMAQAATLIANGCKVVQPTVAGVATATGNGAVALGSTVNGVFCAANEAAVAGKASAPVAASQ